MTSRIAPIVTAESATLNVGQRLTCTKSITAPRMNPGARNTRSIKLPIAPPKTNDRATSISVSSARRTARTRKNATTTASTARRGVNAWNRLNAPPVLRANRRSTVSPMIEIGASASSWTAQTLLSTSRATTPSTMAMASPVRGEPVRAAASRAVLPPSFGTRLALDAGLRVRQGVEALE